MSLMRRVLDSLLPPGAIWRVKKGGYMDKLHEGMSANAQTTHDFLADVGHVRDPARTTALPDLEREFGVTPSDGMTDATRRAVLGSKMFSRGLKGQYWVLQNAINQAGFVGVNVYPNDPAVDPGPFILGTAQMVCGGSNAYAGRSDAYAARYGGVLIVNGAQFVNTPRVVGCGSGLVSCHTFWAGQLNTNICGGFTYSQATALNYGAPVESYRWPLVFFLAASATYDGSGHITALTQCSVSSARFSELSTLILHYKPLHSWAALIYSN
jgi:hypothetical protein